MSNPESRRSVLTLIVRARWWHYVAAVGMCLCGVAGFISRDGLVYRDPDMRSCRVYGLKDGLFVAHTHGGSVPRGWSSEIYVGRGWQWWPVDGLVVYTSIADPNTYYRSDWSVHVPIWLPFAAFTFVLMSRFKPWWAKRMWQLERRVEHKGRLKRAALIRAGLCPMCRYDISTLPRTGVRSCPECGAAAVSRRVPLRLAQYTRPSP